jgi:hypothetical protein
LEHFLFFHILGSSSSQLTFIFFRGVETANQSWFHHEFMEHRFSQAIPTNFCGISAPIKEALEGVGDQV